MGSKSLMVAVSLAVLGGCQTIDNAGLVYGSRTIGGIDVSGGPQGANGGANISFGYKREDLAFIPVAVCEKKDGAGCKKIEKISGFGIAKANLDAAIEKAKSGTANEATAEAIIKDLGADSTPESVSAATAILSSSLGAEQKVQQILKAAHPGGKDSLSVFGSFEGRGVGSASSVEASVGNVFATGIAAQNVSASIGHALVNRSLAACLDAVRRATKEANDTTPLDPKDVQKCVTP